MDDSLQTREHTWLASMRQAWEGVFVGIDHHARQLTVAAATGAEFQAQRATKNAGWMPTAVFAQDGLGYVDLLEWLAERFPDVPRERFVFVMEPTFAKPACGFLATVGFEPENIHWVKTTEVGFARKAKGIGNAGKNDLDDARTLATMAFEAATSPHERRALFRAAPHAPLAEGLRHLAEDNARVARGLVAIQNRITDLVLRLFPECRRVWNKKLQSLKPGGLPYEQRGIHLFGGELPMKVLQAYPGAGPIARAGFDELWARFGGRGIRKQLFRDLVALAERSGGLDSPLDAKRLQLLIEEYQGLRRQRDAYRTAMVEVLEADPVTASLQHIAFLGPQALATIIGAMGDLARFESYDAMKRYLNLAPSAMPQTGNVDERGRPVQIWRLPANTYKRANGRQELVYEAPGMKTVREVGYLWFETMVKCGAAAPDDPFVKLYRRMKAQHQGKPRWYGKVRWKVIAKMVGVIYHCLRKQTAYKPTLVFGTAAALQPCA